MKSETKEMSVALSACALLMAVFAIGLAWTLGVRDAERSCYRGSAAYLDCDLLSPCESPRVVDPVVEYAKRHPECRASAGEAQRATTTKIGVVHEHATREAGDAQ